MVPHRRRPENPWHERRAKGGSFEAEPGEKYQRWHVRDQPWHRLTKRGTEWPKVGTFGPKAVTLSLVRH